MVEAYEDEVLSRGFNFFHSCFSKIMLSILFALRKVKLHVIFDRKNNNNILICDAPLIAYYERNFNSDVPY